MKGSPLLHQFGITFPKFSNTEIHCPACDEIGGRGKDTPPRLPNRSWGLLAVPLESRATKFK